MGRGARDATHKTSFVRKRPKKGHAIKTARGPKKTRKRPTGRFAIKTIKKTGRARKK
jgi:hypothetical protein